jgi:hypothetical protein
MLAEYLARLATQYVFERAKPFAGSAFASFVRHDIAVEAKKTIALWPYDLTLKASVGQGNWASVPWLAFFHPLRDRRLLRRLFDQPNCRDDHAVDEPGHHGRLQRIR